MKTNNITLRIATPSDAAQILEIYKLYVQKTAISFEYEVPSPEEFSERISNTLKKYPYIVAEQAGEILGYAYMGAFSGRAAYDWSAESSIYLKEGKKKLGLGARLYQAIEAIAKAQNILNLTACIAYPEVEDEYLTKNSVQFHEHLGYELVGRFHKCGYKFDRWYDIVWMQKLLGEHSANPAPIISFPNLSAETLHNLGIKSAHN
mgnify:CR=1 FL=1